ncbi:MAG TPA: hypothetical protein DDX29_01275 [Clostridiales bacterium]|nr:hypothetical protein [Clostridiales bacterium]
MPTKKKEIKFTINSKGCHIMAGKGVNQVRIKLYNEIYPTLELDQKLLATCGNLACINPSHMRAIINLDYYEQDTLGQRRLEPADVKFIRECDNMRAVDLADKYGVSEGTILCIQSYKRWRYVP